MSEKLYNMLKEQDAQIATLTRERDEARAQLAAANATIEKCKAIAEKALEEEDAEPTLGAAFGVCCIALRNIITAAEAAREGRGKNDA